MSQYNRFGALFNRFGTLFGTLRRRTVLTTSDNYVIVTSDNHIITI